MLPIARNRTLPFTLLYLKEAGMSSYIDIDIIIPAIIASKTLIITSFIKGAKNKYAIIAPIGSDIPEINVYKMALNLFLVL